MTFSARNLHWSATLRQALAEVQGLFILAAPLVAGLVLSTSTMLVDTAMLGPLGALPLAAVSLTTSVVIIFYAALYGFAGPVGLFAGRAFGAQDAPGIGEVARHGLLLAACGGGCGAVLMAAVLPLLQHLGQPPEVLAVLTPYWYLIAASLLPFTIAMAGKNLLDATGHPWLSVALTAVPVVINVFLNYLLIQGRWGAPALGLTGAGVASLLGQTAGAAVIWAWARWSCGCAAWWVSGHWSMRALMRQAREAWPMTLQYFLEGAAVAVAGLMIGLMGPVAMAGNQIALSVGSTLYMLPLGMSAAVSIRVSQALGAQQTARVAPIGWAGLGVVTAWMVMSALLYWIAGGHIAAAFIDDPAVVAAATAVLFVFAWMQLMDGVQSVSLGALRGMLDNDWPTRVSLIAYWLISLPLAAAMGLWLGWGAPGVWAGFGAGLAFASVALLRRFFYSSRALREPMERPFGV